MKRTRALRRSQLDEFFQHLRSINLKAPKMGWVKEIREALGMTMQDLANRMGTIKQRIERIEKDEIAKKTTLESIKKIAEAMDCDFVYFFVPRVGLQQSLNAQALRAAEQIVKNVGRTMDLEAQGTSEKSKSNLVNQLAQEMIAKEDRKIWRVK